MLLLTYIVTRTRNYVGSEATTELLFSSWQREGLAWWNKQRVLNVARRPILRHASWAHITCRNRASAYAKRAGVIVWLCQTLVSIFKFIKRVCIARQGGKWSFTKLYLYCLVALPRSPGLSHFARQMFSIRLLMQILGVGLPHLFRPTTPKCERGLLMEARQNLARVWVGITQDRPIPISDIMS